MTTYRLRTARLRRALLTLPAVLTAFLLVSAPAQATSSYQSTILADSPAGYWTFDDGSDMGADASGNSQNGSVSGSLPTTTGIDGTAGLFNGNTDVDAPDINLGTSFTVEAWFATNYQVPAGSDQFIMNRDDFNGWTRIFQLRIGSAGKGEFIALSDGSDQGQIQHTYSAGALNDGKWHYVAAVVQGNATADTTTSTLYVDGEPVARTTSPGLEPTSGSDIGLGAASGMSGGSDFHGALDEMAVYDKALTAAQIQAHYAAGGGYEQVPQSALLGTDNPSDPDLPVTTDGEPVNDATGNFTASHTDLSVGGSAPLDFQRTYNSLSAGTDGSLGYGWTTSYSDSLSVDGSTATVTAANGSTTTFDVNTNGTFTPLSWEHATLVQNSDGTYTYTLPDGSSEVFSSTGQLASETDLHGNTTTLTYNASEQLTQITGPSGRSLTLAYNAAGQLASVTDPLNRQVTYTYDSAGDLTEVDDPGGRDWQYTYDSNHNLLTVTDPRDNVVLTNTYDAQDRVTQQTDALNRTTTWAYTQTDADDSETVVTLPNGSVSDYYFQDNEPVKTITAEGTSDQVTTTATYNTNGELASSTDGNDGTTTYTYDADGNKLTETDPLNRETAWTYDAANQVTSETLPSGAETIYAYDSHENLLTKAQVPAPGSTSPTANLTTTYAYTDSSFPSLPTSMTDPNGKTTTYGYDSNGDLTSTTQPDGEETTYGYDADGEQTSVTAPKGNIPPAEPAAYTTTTTYNAAGQPLTVTDPMGNETTYTYDLDGNKTSVTNAANKETTYTYDADNELTKTTNPDNDTTQKSYDSMGNVATETDGDGNVTTNTYNAQNELSSTETAMNQTTSYTYDADGNRLTTTDPQGRVTIDSYDPDDELTGISYSDGTTPNVSYTYTPDGQVSTMTDGTGTTTYTYDGVDRLISVKDGAGNTVGYALDADGNETGITYPNGKTITYAFNGDGQMTSLTDWASRKTTFAYDPNGNLTSTVDGDTVSTTDANTYNADDQLTGIAGTQTVSGSPSALYSIAYTRTSLGQVASETDSGITGATNPTYAYNSDGHMTSAATSAPDAWVYDDAGNPTTESGSTGFTYNADDQLTQAGGSSYSYSADGNERTSDTWSAATESYAYDQAGNLTEVSHPAYGSEAALAVTYTYDGNGLRQSFTQNGTLHTLTWDVSASEPLLLVENSTDYVYGPGGRPVEQIQGSSANFFHLDQQNSVRLLTNLAGTVVDSYTYSPYGKLVASSGSTLTRLMWDGEFYESATNLYYMRARSYDPTTEQFMSRDPLAEQTMQPYEYAGDDPVDYSDPSGLTLAGGACNFWDVVCDVTWDVHHPAIVAAAEGTGVACALTDGTACTVAGLAATDYTVVKNDVSEAEHPDCAAEYQRSDGEAVAGLALATVTGGVGRIMAEAKAPESVMFARRQFTNGVLTGAGIGADKSDEEGACGC